MTNPPVQAAGATPRDAIIYVPGLLRGEDRIGLGGFAKRLAASLDRNAATRKAQFQLTEGNVVEYREGLESKRVTIERQEGGAQEPIIDVFEFDYRDAIRERLASRAPIRQAAAIAWLLFAHIPHFFGFLKRKGKGGGDKLQLAIAGAAIVTIMLYLVILILTAAGTAVQAIEGTDLLGSTEKKLVEAKPDPAEAAGDPFNEGVNLLRSNVSGAEEILGRLQALIVLLTGLGLLSKGNIKQLIEDVSIEYASLINYISSQGERSELTGRFADLLEHVHESDTPYRKINVIGYSFGSVVAIDCVFGFTPPSAGLKSLNALVTVGSPFDVVRSFFPGYFSSRSEPGVKTLTWLNVYSPEDILSSNFRDDEEVNDRCDVGIKIKGKGKKQGEVKPTNVLFGPGTPEQKSWPWVRLVRLRELHTAYWGKSANAKTFLADVVPKLYAAGDPILR